MYLGKISELVEVGIYDFGFRSFDVLEKSGHDFRQVAHGADTAKSLRGTFYRTTEIRASSGDKSL